MILFCSQVRAEDKTLLNQWRKLYYLELNASKSFYFTENPNDLISEINKAKDLFSQKDNWDSDLHFQCRFPARFELIQKSSGGQLPKSKCPSFDKWMASLSPEGISLIFAGNYPDNPGSIFGHTFLKVRSSNSHHEILDYALNYAANVADELGFLYAMKGLFGGYYGAYSMDPYYVKVNDYSEGEGRDLWEYELNINSQESKFLLSHFWEVRYQAQFRYYFLDDNCSYLILKLIDVTKPEWNLLNSDPAYVIPIETVKLLKSKVGRIKATNYRPSIRKRAEKAYDNLRFHEKNQVIGLLNSSIKPTSISNPHVLNTTALKFLSNQSKNDGKINSADQDQLNETMARLASLDTSKIETNFQVPGDPAESHNVKQVSLGFGQQSSNYMQLSFRPGLHDLTDFPRGYLDYSELVALDASLRFIDQKVSLQRLEIFDLQLLRPITLSERSFSWKTRWSYQNQSQIFCQFCRSVYGEAGVGLAQHLIPKTLVYAMAGGFINAGSDELSHAKGGANIEIGTITNFNEQFRFIFALNSYLNVMNTISGRTLHLLSAKATYNVTKDFEINLISTSGIVITDSDSYKQDLLVSTDYHF